MTKQTRFMIVMSPGEHAGLIEKSHQVGTSAATIVRALVNGYLDGTITLDKSELLSAVRRPGPGGGDYGN